MLLLTARSEAAAAEKRGAAAENEEGGSSDGESKEQGEGSVPRMQLLDDAEMEASELQVIFMGAVE